MKNRLNITRRDFINGVSYGLAASVAPIDYLRANGIDIENYPPALTGIEAITQDRTTLLIGWHLMAQVS